MGNPRWRWNYTHTTAVYGFASLPTDPEVSGTAVHKDGKITRRGANLDGGNVANVIPSVKGYQSEKPPM